MSTTLDEFAVKLAAAMDKKPAAKPDEKKPAFGGKSAAPQGSATIYDKATAIAAIKKRHSAKPPLTTPQLNALLTRAAKFAPDEAAAARAQDKANGKL